MQRRGNRMKRPNLIEARTRLRALYYCTAAAYPCRLRHSDAAAEIQVLAVLKPNATRGPTLGAGLGEKEFQRLLANHA